METSTLSSFIRANIEPILVEWEAFARTCTPAAEGMNVIELRDHAAKMLRWIADDLDTSQTNRQRDVKAQGLSDDVRGTSVASQHGEERYNDQFTLAQIFAEFRALRSSVITLWTKDREVASAAELSDLTRFNEAIDQVIAESVERFSDSLEESREMFTAILGHDLRTPLGAIIIGASYLQATLPQQSESLEMVTRILNSGNRMQRLIADILDFSRIRLGGNLPIYFEEMDMDEVGRHIIDEAVTSNPGRQVRFIVQGDVRGHWDPERVGQVMSNLIANALQHGEIDRDVAVTLRGEADEVVLSVQNWGPLVADKDMDIIFDATKRLANNWQEDKYHTGLGLGLHIVRTIVLAHGGTVRVDSTAEQGTTFTAHWPRFAASFATEAQPITAREG